MEQQGEYQQNAAAWQMKPGSDMLAIYDAPYESPKDDYVTVQVECVAINPVDNLVQNGQAFEMEYPAILGVDMAGEIREVGKNVKGFTEGQRVICLGDVYGTKDASHGAFQRYAQVPARSIALVPDEWTFEEGVVLPLGITTAAAGLYQRGFLALPLPPASEQPEPLKRTILVWGGGSSVGTSAIQLAVASGATVITTASPINNRQLLELGAEKCFDYHKDTVEDDIKAYLKGHAVAGAFHANGTDETVRICARIVDHSFGKAIVVTTRGVPKDGIPNSVRVKAISSSTIFEKDNPVGPYIWKTFLPVAMTNGKVLARPGPATIGYGLISLQHGLDRSKQGRLGYSKLVVNSLQYA